MSLRAAKQRSNLLLSWRLLRRLGLDTCLVLIGTLDQRLLAMTELSRLHVFRKGDELLRDFRANACLGFFRSSADMRRTDHVIEPEQFPVGGRFFGEDV